MRQILVNIRENWIAVLLAVVAVAGYIYNDYRTNQNIKEAVARGQITDCLDRSFSASLSIVSNDVDRQVYAAAAELTSNPDISKLFANAAKTKKKIISSIKVRDCAEKIRDLKKLGIKVPKDVVDSANIQSEIKKIDLNDGLNKQLKRVVPPTTPHPDDGTEPPATTPRDEPTPTTPSEPVPGPSGSIPSPSTPVVPNPNTGTPSAPQPPSPSAPPISVPAPPTVMVPSVPSITTPPITVGTPEPVIIIPSITTPSVDIEPVIDPLLNTP